MNQGGLVTKTILSVSILLFSLTSNAEIKSASKVRVGKNRTRAEIIPSKPSNQASTSSLTSSNTSTTTTTPWIQNVHASYTGIMAGPILDSEINKTNNISVSNRIAAKVDLNEKFDAGLQARLNTSFTADGFIAANENWRLFSNIKKIYDNGVVDFNLTPRLMLPTSNGAHNQKLILGPELIATLNFNPKNTRFSFDYKIHTQKNFYSDSIASNKAMNFYLLHNFEANYTISSTTELNLGVYPEYLSTNSAAFTNSSNELDIGLSWSFTKGWSLNPYLATELKGLDSTSLGKNMQANLILSGAFL
jgi:hypothetical protein